MNWETNTKTVKKQRDANLDLLRIVSMLLIVFLHSIDHSGVMEAAETSSSGIYLWVRFAYALCQVCVNCFVLLSGYYLVNSTFRLQKVVILWMEMVFYAFVQKALFMILGEEPLSLISLVSCFFPILTGRYWFMTIYVGLYLIAPFLNVAIKAMDRKQHTILNICLFALFSLWVSVHPSIAGMNSGGGWGVVLYFVAAWFRLYYKPTRKPGTFFCAFFGVPLLIAVAQLGAKKLNVGILQSVLDNWFRYDSAPVYIMTVSLFAGFLNVKIQNKWITSWICKMAPLTLGVYLIHAHANVSPWLWESLALPEKMNSILFPVIQLGYVLGIFVVCIAIDAVRRCTVGKLENSQLVYTSCKKISGWFHTKFTIKD